MILCKVTDMKQLLAIFILAGALVAASAQTQTNSPAPAIMNIAAQTPAASNAPVNAKTAMPRNATLVVLDDEARTLLHKATEEPFIKTDTLVQSSPDMSAWTTRATILLTSSPYLWIDQNPVSGNQFYRALLLP